MNVAILKRAVAAGLVAVLALICVPADASDIRAKVPFSFTVREALLPAGDYSVTRSGGSALVVRGLRGGAIVLGQGTASTKGGTPKLVFHRYGDEYILREVWMSGQSGYLLNETRRERELSRALKGSGAVAGLQRVEVPLS